MKHTPGPWCCKPGCTREATLDIQNPWEPGTSPADFTYQSCSDHVWYLLATGGTVAPIEDQTQAQLLEALEAVVRVADRKTDEFDQARAAIAKARGEK